jgi:flagellar basal-body rod modification protein FlgD
MSTSISPITQSAAATDTTSTSAATKDPLANEATFLKLLVSQLQNQDPLSPVDSNQFVSQLTSYSQLEQLIGIHKDTTALGTAASSAGTGTTTPSGGATVTTLP